jgi:predicted nucleic acid-binding protein
VEAAALAGRLRETRAVTSNLVLGEVWTLLARRLSHFHARSWLDRVHRELAVSVEGIEPELEEEAWTWLRRHDERPYSFVDATSFALMRKLRISEALAFDGDFAAAGFVELRP